MVVFVGSCVVICLDLCLLFFKFLIYIATMPGSDLLPIEMLTLHLRTVVVFVRGDAISVRGLGCWLVGGSGILSEATLQLWELLLHVSVT